MVLEVIGILGLGIMLVHLHHRLADGAVAVHVRHGRRLRDRAIDRRDLVRSSRCRIRLSQRGAVHLSPGGRSDRHRHHRHHLDHRLATTTTELEDRGVPPEQAQQVGEAVAGSAGQAIPALAQQPDGQVLVEGASQGFANAIKTVAWVAGGFVFLGLLTSFTLPKNAARVESEGYEPPKKDEESSAAP
jgi:hypothetical protein